MSDRKLIELIIDEEQDNFAVEALSLVKFPAIESDFIFLSKQNKCLSLAAIDEEQRTLIGPALIPDKNIPRFDDVTEEEYDVYFSKETVKRASELFLEQKRTSDHTFEHQSAITDVHVVESWIVQDPDMDKSKAYGLSVPEGTWMVRVRVDNDEVWDSVKSGEVRGFSIEGYFVDRVHELGQRKENAMMASLMSKVKAWLQRRNFYQEIGLTSGHTLVTDADDMVAGVSVYTLDEVGMPADMPDGSYQTDNGINLQVSGGTLVMYDGVEVEAVVTPDPAAEGTGTPADDLRSSMLTLYYKKLLEQRANKTNMSKTKKTNLSYNGWRNWETWSVALYWVDDLVNMRDDYGEGYRYDRDQIEEMVTDAVYDGIGADNFMEHIVGGFLQDVDWTSITEAANEE